MKFVVSRTSEWDDPKPCEEAEREEGTYYTDCFCATVAEALKHGWVQEGIPEQREGFVRVYDKTPKLFWVIEINTLEELIALYEKYGELIVRASHCKEIPVGIEIYDDYRE